ncbi:MAG: hypothetical protein V4714_15535 [Bacteroidota bacterium]
MSKSCSFPFIDSIDKRVIGVKVQNPLEKGGDAQTLSPEASAECFREIDTKILKNIKKKSFYYLKTNIFKTNTFDAIHFLYIYVSLAKGCLGDVN